MKKSSGVILLLLVMILAISAVGAADTDATPDLAQAQAADDSIAVPIDDSSDDVVQAANTGVLAAGEQNFTQLQNDIDTATGAVLMSSDYVRVDGDSDIEITKDTTILGNNYKIDANNKGGIFKVNQGFTLTLIGVTLINGNANSGAAIYNDGGSVTIVDSYLLNNTATSNGGAIYNDGGSLTATGTVFDGNDLTARRANSGGAAIFDKGGTILLSDCNVTNNLKNIVPRGGYDDTDDLCSAAVSSSGTLTITNSYFSKNSGSYGGAILVNETGFLTVSGTTFEDNYAFNGGAIDIVNDASYSITDCTFKGNVANGTGSKNTNIGSGGAISAQDVSAGSVISNCIFEDNAAAYGGAIDATIIEIVGCTFTDNIASSSYAGTFKGSPNNRGGEGGAIRITRPTTTVTPAITIRDSVFNNNGGTGNYYGVSLTRANSEITGSSFTNTVIYMATAGSAILSDNTFDNDGFTSENYDIYSSNTIPLTLGEGQVPKIKLGKVYTEINNFTRLQEVIDNVSGSIYLTGDVVKLASEAETFANGILINKTISIYGEGYTITSNSGKVFNVANGVELTLYDANIVGDGTSAIVNDGKVTLQKANPSTFSNVGNYAIENNGIVAEASLNTFTQLNNLIALVSGGEVYIGTCTITKADDEKEAFKDGIVIDKDLTITGFYRNYIRTIINADNSGRIFNVTNGATLTLQKVILQNGNATDGGAVYVNAGATLNADTVAFNDNTATNRGGAIYAYDGNLDITSATFKNNVAVKGGAIYAGAENNNVTVNIADSTFSDNKAYQQGGAIEFTQNNAAHSLNYNITGSAFNDNFASNTIGTTTVSTATVAGGAIYSAGYSVGSISNCSFSNNEVIHSNAPMGGAIKVQDYSIVTVKDCNFTKNEAAQGGAIGVQGEWNAKATVIVDNCNFTENQASVYGGAIAAANNGGCYADLTVKDSTFTKNHGYYFAGAILVNSGSSADISGSTFVENSGDVRNRTIQVGSNANISLSRNTVDGEIYVYDGGAVETTYTATILANQTVNTTTGQYELNATLVDDNGNPIHDNNLRFTVNGVEIASLPTYNNGVYTLEYTLFTDYPTFIIGVNTTNTDNLVVKTGTVKNLLYGTYTDLQGKINAATGELNLTYDFAYNAEIDDANFPDGVVIAKDLTINGNGYTIDGNNSQHIFCIIDGDVVLNNITFTKSVCDDGVGAIYTNTTLTVANSTFIDNKATKEYANGAAIMAEAAGKDITLNIINTIFKNNNVDNGGAAVTVATRSKKVTYNIYDSLFENNTATNNVSGANVAGGAIFSYGNAVGYINNTKFIDNKAVSDYLSNGGAIKVQFGGTLTVANSTFQGNVAGHSGGAIDVQGSTGTANTLIVDTCTFAGNNAADFGAAIASAQTSGNSVVTIKNSEFGENSAVYLDAKTDAEISDSKFTGTDYTINNTGTLKLANNTGVAVRNGGTITSQVIATVLENGTADAVYGQTVELNATLTDDNGNPIYDKDFKFKVAGATDLIDATYADGLYTATYKVDQVGEKIVSAVLGYDVTVKTGLLNISRANVVLTIDANDTIMRKYNETITVNLADEYGNLLNLTVDVHVTNSTGDDIFTGSVTTVNGTYTFELTGLGVDTYTIVALFDNENYNFKITTKGFEVIELDANGTFTQVQNLIDGAEINGTIIIPNDIAYDDFVDEDKFADGILINKNITIDGNGTTIDANKKYRIFTIADGIIVTIKNLTMKNGNATIGGAILTSADDLLLDACNFIGNDPVYGAALFISEGIVTVNGDSLFENNTAAQGGAIYVNPNAKLIVDGATFKNNTVTEGGAAITIESAEFDIKDASFIENYADNAGAITCGGAIWLYNSTGAIASSVFNGNYVTGTKANGGAIKVQQGCDVEIDDCTFENNAAPSGGAISVQAWDGQDNTVVITNSHFIKNTATIQGGAIYVAQNLGVSTVSIADSEFKQNAAINGSAIAVKADTTLNVKGTNFTDNDATEVGGAIYATGIYRYINNGAEIYNLYAPTVNIDGAKFTDNDATYGGAIFIVNATIDSESTAGGYPYVDNDQASLSVTNSEFTKNTANGGGAIAIIENVTYNIAGSTFDSNVATGADNGCGSGGAIYAEGATVGTVTGSEFKGNKALGNDNPNGGAIKVQFGGEATIKDCTFTENTAALTGGAINVQANAGADCLVTVDNCTFTKNTAAAGGAISALQTAGESKVIIKDSTFTENEAAIYGGAVYYGYSTTVEVEGSEFVNNTAGKYGGAIHALNNLTVSGSKFIDNDAIYGGAISAEAKYTDLTVKVTDSEFTKNTATGGGAGISLGAENNVLTYEIAGSTFEDNVATGTDNGCGSGGAIYAEGTTVGTVTDSEFKGNKALGNDYPNGGAIKVQFGAQAVILRSNFTDNGASYSGGAIDVQAKSGADCRVVVVNSTFDGNYADVAGGAIASAQYHGNSNVIIRNSNFTDNGNCMGGAAIYLDALSQSYIGDCAFEDNDATIYNAAIYNAGNLSLYKNTVDTVIFNAGEIASQTYISVLDNSTVELDYGESVKLNATILDDNNNTIIGKGSLAFTVEGDNAIINATFNETTYYYEAEYTPLGAGPKVVSATYTAMDTLTKNTVLTGLLSIAKINITEFYAGTGQNDVFAYDANVTIFVGLYGLEGVGLNDTVLVFVNNTPYTVNVTDGQGSFNVTGFEPGQYAIFAIFAGNNDYNGPEVTSDVFTVLNPDRILSIVTVDGVYDAPAIINITITDAEGNEDYGIVVLNISGEIFTVTVDGNASFEYYGEPSVYTINATLLPDYYALDGSVVNDTESFNISANDGSFIDIDVGDDICDGETLYVNVTITDGLGQPIEGVTVTYSIDGGEPQNTTAITDENGTLVLPIEGLDFGEHNITVTFNDNYHDVAAETVYVFVDPRKGTFTDLQFHILVAEIIGEDMLSLPYDFTYNETYDSLYYDGLENGILIANPIVIFGNGYTISGNNQARIFNITAEAVLSDINFVNGSADYGAAIYTTADLTVDGCTFEDNNATAGGGAIAIDATENDVEFDIEDSEFIRNGAVNDAEQCVAGGAVYIEGAAEGIIDECEFIDNVADSSFRANGGAIKVQFGGKVIIEDSYFENNNAGANGGAISIQANAGEDCDVIVDNCIFVGNDPETAGGAISVLQTVGQSTLTVTDSQFIGNEAGVGGAIYSDDLSTVIVKNTRFEKNNATKGAAIYALGDLTVEDCIFVENTAELGGAIFVSDKYGAVELGVYDSTFVRNNASDAGGAIAIDATNGNGIGYTIFNSEFEENMAVNDDEKVCVAGGAIFTEGTAIGYIGECNFTENGAVDAFRPNGGAIKIQFGGDVLIEDSYFENNYADLNGGAISVQAKEGADCNVVIDDCTFIENIAGSAGGAISALQYQGTSTVTVTDSYFSGNGADDVGGAIYSDDLSTVTVTYSEFDENQAGKGGAIYALGALEVTSTGFIDNSGDGAAIFISDKYAANELYVDDCYFAGNDADTAGGAILIDATNGNGIRYVIANSTFIANTAISEECSAGGAIYAEGDCTGLIFNDEFTANEVDSKVYPNGGAIKIQFGAKALIANCTFVGNEAGLSGGAIDVQAKDGANCMVVVANSTFTDNSAQAGGAIASLQNSGNSTVIIINSIFTENGADLVGGAIYADDLTTIGIKGSEFEDNYAEKGGAIYLVDGAIAAIDDSEFITNLAGPLSFQIYQGGNTLEITNCLFVITAPTIEAEKQYTYGDVITINGTFDWGVNNKVIEMVYDIDGNEFTTNVTDGKFTILIDTQPDVGTYVITIDRFADADGNVYAVRQAQAIFEIVQAESTISINASKYVMPGANATVQINVTGIFGEGLDGIVIVTVNDRDYVVPVEDGLANLTISGLVPNEYPVLAVFLGNENYIGAVNDTETIDFFAHIADFDIVIDDITYGEELVVVVENVTDSDGNLLNGTVIVIIPTSTLMPVMFTVNVTDGEGVGILNTTLLDADIYNVTAAFIGQGFKYISSSKELIVIVDKAPAFVNASADDYTCITNGTLLITVTDINDMLINGTAYVEIDGEIYALDIPVVNGTASVELTGLEVGSHDARITFDADNYRTVENTIHFNVTKVTAVINASDITIRENENATIVVTVPSDAAGVVLVEVNGKKYYADIEAGSATVVVSDLDAGNYTANIAYLGDDIYTGAATTINVTVTALMDPNFNVTVSEDPKVGDVLNITITVLEDAVNGSFVQILLDGYPYMQALTNATTVVPAYGLPAGEHTLMVRYSGNDEFDEDYAVFTFNVTKVDTVINASDVAIKEGASATIVVTVPSDAEGVILVDINGEKYYGDIEAGSATIVVDGLAAYEYPAGIYYPGDDKYTAVATSIVVNVTERAIAEVNVNVTDDGITVSLPENATGQIAVFADGKLVNTVPLVNGSATVPVELAPGNHTVTVIYSGDENYAPILDDASVEIAKANTTISANNVTIKQGASATIVAEVPSDAKGVILVDIDGKKYYGEIKSGIATIVVDGLAEGNYSAVISYPGDDYFAEATTAINVEVIHGATAELNVTVPSEVKIGDTPSVNVTLPEDAKGNVSVLVNGEEIANVPVKDGSAVVPVTGLTVGSNTVEVRYTGDDKYAPASSTTTVNMTKIDTVIEVVPEFTRVANDYNAGERGAMFYAYLKDTNGNPIANRTVQIAVNGPIYNKTTDENGRIALQINLAVATVYTYAMSFQGDDIYNASKLASSRLTVTKKATTISASNVVFKASAKTKTVTVTLKVSKNPYDGKTYLSAGKKITLTVNGKTYTAKADAKGVAKFNINISKKGTYTAKVAFAGDYTYKASKKSIKITIK